MRAFSRGSRIQRLAEVVSRGRRPVSRDVQTFLRSYSELPALRSNVDLLARAVAAVRWQVLLPARGRGARAAELRHLPGKVRRAETRLLLRAGELRPEPEDGPLTKFLRAGVRDAQGLTILTGLQVRRLVVIDRILAGESFCILERDGASGARRDRGRPVEQVPWAPHLVTDVPRLGGGVFRVRNLDGREEPFEPVDVLWRRDPDPEEPYGRGSAVAASVAVDLEADEELGRYELDYFGNSARPELLVTGQFGGQPEARRAELLFRQKLRGQPHQAHFLDTGASEDGKTLGEIEVHDLSRSIQELAVDPLRKGHWEVVRQVLTKAPPELFGVTGQSNRATIDGAWYVFGKVSIETALEEEREFLLERVVPEFGEGILVDYDSPVDDDWEYNLRVAISAPYSRTVDEWRALGGLEPMGDAAGGNLRPVPLGVRFVASLAEAGRPTSLAAPRSWADLPLDRGLRRDILDDSDAIESIARSTESDVRAVFEAAVEATRGEVDPAEIERLLNRSVEAALAAVPAEQFGERVREVAAVLLAVLSAAGERAAAALAQALGSEVTFDIGRPEVERWVATRADELGVWAEQSARTAASVILAEASLPADLRARAVRDWFGVEERDASRLLALVATLTGEAPTTATLSELAVEDDVRHSLDARAALFAVVQSYDTVQEGQRQSWQQARDDGVLPAEARRVWETVGDERVCQVCSPLHGQRRRLEEPFVHPETGARYMNPGDPHRGWKNPCRCRVHVEV